MLLTWENDGQGVDPGTLELLAEYKEHCRKEALAAGGELDENGFIFSSDGLGKVPWSPDTVSHWFRQVADAAGVQATMHGLRHYNATQMLSSGIDLRTAAGRLGHSGGGAVTLCVYAHRARPTDQRAAELRGELVGVGLVDEVQGGGVDRNGSAASGPLRRCTDLC